MSGLSTKQIDELKHSVQMSKDTRCTRILEMLWYTTTKESPLQRSTDLDGTLFDRSSAVYNPIVDEYSLLLFKKLLQVSLAVEVDSCLDLEARVDSIYDSKDKALVILNDGKNSFVYSFFNKLRNAVAHGSFNLFRDGSALFVGQNSASLSAKMNYYLRIGDITCLLSLMNDLRSFTGKSVSEFQSQVYSMYRPLIKTSGGYYKRDDGSEVYFDNGFQFINKIEKKQSEQLEEYLQANFASVDNDGKNKRYLLLSCSTQLKLEELEKSYGICIVPANKLFEHVEL